MSYSIDHLNCLITFNNNLHLDAINVGCILHVAYIYTCLHVCSVTLQIPVRTILRGGWYLRLKQIKRYQAFRTGDKEYRGNAEVFEAFRSDIIGKSFSAFRALTHIIFSAHCALDDYIIAAVMINNYYIF